MTKLHYSYVNEGYLASTGTFVVETAPVWKAGAGNAVVDTFVQGPMPRNQPVRGHIHCGVSRFRVDGARTPARR